MMNDRIDRRDAWIVAAFVAALVASRLAWVHWYLDTSLYWEESYRWISAIEILRGPTQPILDYQADHYQGGSLVMILLSLPFLRVFGESMAVMKLSAIAFSSAILALLYVLARRTFGRPTAIIAALAYLAGPPLVAYWGVIVMGSHHESALFSLLQILVFYGLLTGARRTPAAWALFGIVSGLGLWFCYTSGLSLVACGLTWLVLEGLPRPRETAAALVGGIAGLAIWFAYNAGRGFVGIRRVVELFGYGNPIDTWEPQTRMDKVLHLVSSDLPLGLVLPFDGPWPSWVTTLVVVAFVVPLTVALAAAVARTARAFAGDRERPARAAGRMELVFVVYGVVFLAFYLGSKFTVDRDLGAVSYRLFLAPAVLLMIPAARTTALAFGAGPGVRRFAIVGCALYLAASAWGSVLLATRTVEPMGDGAHWVQIGHTTRGVLLHRKYEDDIAAALASARRVADPSLRFRVLQGIGWGMQYRFETSRDVQRIAQDLAEVPTRERFAMLSGLRAFAGLRIKQLGQRNPRPGSTLADDLTRLVAWADDEWTRLPPRYRTVGHVPDEAPGARDFDVEVSVATANADAKQRFRLLQNVGGWLVAGFEADGDVERLQRDLDSVPIGIRFAVLSGLRFYAAVRLRAVHERLRDPNARAEEQLRAGRLSQLVELGDAQWHRVPAEYLRRDWVDADPRAPSG